MITLISAIGGIPTIYPFNGYGGIERIVGDLAHALVERGQQVRIVGGMGSHVDGCEIIEHRSEQDALYDEYEGDVIDFSHGKIYNHDKHSVPFFTDAGGTRPIYPSVAVMRAFNAPAGKFIYPGIDLSEYNYVEEKEDFYVYIGRIAPYKGTEILPYLARQHGLRIVVAGHDGDYVPYGYPQAFRDRCRDAGIEYLGQVSEKKKRDLLERAKGLIFAPNWKLVYNVPVAVESFGITAVEAVASGTPVFTNNMLSGIREIITGGFGAAYTMQQWGDMADYERPPRSSWIMRAQYFTSQRYAGDLLDYLADERMALEDKHANI